MNAHRPLSVLLTALLASLLLSPLPLSPLLGAAQGKGDYLVYVGTNTGGKKSQGIYVCRLHAATGQVTPLGLAAETVNPSFLAAHPNHRFLYAVSEVAGGGPNGGAVAAFTIDSQTGKLTLLNKVSSKGSGPAHVSVDKTGKTVFVANYNSGSVAALPIKEDGSLGEASAFVQHTGSGANPKRQEGPHAHWIGPSPDNRFVLACDLGLDEVLVYRFDAAKGTLTPNDPPFGKAPPGAGPRHFAFHPSGRFGYVINEMASSVTAFAFDASRGSLTPLQTISTLPQDFTGNNSGAELEMHPSGKFLYGSNRGHNSIAVFAVDARKGTLTPVEQASTQGKVPRGFGIDPTGSYLFAGNQNSDNVVVFRIDSKTGRLTPAGQTFEVGAPVNVIFVATR
jgi:6-phosphogluconolactonase